jgi:hypothetical protein
LEGKRKGFSEYFIKKACLVISSNNIGVTNVVNRSLILFHPANNASLELNGCISNKLSGLVLGLMSRKAFAN